MTTTDRELLQRAAKAAAAAGMPIIQSEAGPQILERRTADGTEYYRLWAPDTDDGDALRLAVKLKFIVGTYDTYASVCHTMILGGQGDVPDDEVVWVHSTNGDPYAATRRAIVRAAAEIGGE